MRYAAVLSGLFGLSSAAVCRLRTPTPDVPIVTPTPTPDTPDLLIITPAPTPVDPTDNTPVFTPVGNLPVLTPVPSTGNTGDCSFDFEGTAGLSGWTVVNGDANAALGDIALSATGYQSTNALRFTPHAECTDTTSMSVSRSLTGLGAGNWYKLSVAMQYETEAQDLSFFASVDGTHVLTIYTFADSDLSETQNQALGQCSALFAGFAVPGPKMYMNFSAWFQVAADGDGSAELELGVSWSGNPYDVDVDIDNVAITQDTTCELPAFAPRKI